MNVMGEGFRYSGHALEEMERRSISPETADEVLRHPEQIVLVHSSRKAYQSRVDFGNGDVYLVRLIVDDATAPAVVVTAYRTSKISKYWRTS
jgi:hypothetical protein